MAPSTATERQREHTPDTTAVRPFRVDVPEADLAELRRRVAAARLPERETVSDFSQLIEEIRAGFRSLRSRDRRTTRDFVRATLLVRERRGDARRRTAA